MVISGEIAARCSTWRSGFGLLIASSLVASVAPEMTEGATRGLPHSEVTIAPRQHPSDELPGLPRRVVYGAATAHLDSVFDDVLGKSRQLVARYMLLAGRSWHVATAEHGSVSPSARAECCSGLATLEIVTSQGAGPSKRRPRSLPPGPVSQEHRRPAAGDTPRSHAGRCTTDVVRRCRVCNLEALASPALTSLRRLHASLRSSPAWQSITWLERLAAPQPENRQDLVTSGPNVVNSSRNAYDVPLA